MSNITHARQSSTSAGEVSWDAGMNCTGSKSDRATYRTGLRICDAQVLDALAASPHEMLNAIGIENRTIAAHAMTGMGRLPLMVPRNKSNYGQRPAKKEAPGERGAFCQEVSMNWYTVSTYLEKVL